MISSNLEKKQIDLIRESISTYNLCREVIDLYAKEKLSFSRMEEFVDDRGKSSLYRLKQMCHDLFRNVDDATYREKFYDITVGYIFHEAMKLRENVYQLEYYKPQYTTLLNSEELTSLEKRVIHEFDLLIHKAEKRLKVGLQEVKGLLRDLVAQLKDLLKLYRNNYLLPRFVLENEKALVKIYGKRAFAEVLTDMYEYGRSTLVYKAAISYLESEYYGCARLLFQKIANLDQADSSARFMYLYASAHDYYFKNRPVKAHLFAREALALGVKGPDLQPYVQSLQQLFSEVSKELKKRGKLKEGKEYADLRV
jgi:hypothetical protein